MKLHPGTDSQPGTASSTAYLHSLHLRTILYIQGCFLNSFLIIMCVYVHNMCAVGVCVSIQWHETRSQNHFMEFSPSTFMWVLDIEPGSPGFCGKYLCLVSQLEALTYFFLHGLYNVLPPSPQCSRKFNFQSKCFII